MGGSGRRCSAPGRHDPPSPTCCAATTDQRLPDLRLSLSPTADLAAHLSPKLPEFSQFAVRHLCRIQSRVVEHIAAMQHYIIIQLLLYFRICQMPQTAPPFPFVRVGEEPRCFGFREKCDVISRFFLQKMTSKMSTEPGSYALCVLLSSGGTRGDGHSLCPSPLVPPEDSSMTSPTSLPTNFA